jgi:hypothetical protein
MMFLIKLVVVNLNYLITNDDDNILVVLIFYSCILCFKSINYIYMLCSSGEAKIQSAQLCLCPVQDTQMYVPHFYINDVVASVHTIYLCWCTQLLVQTLHILKTVIVFSL